MDSRWFKEDRALPKEDRQEAMEASEKALRNSTLFQRRLGSILEEMIESSERDDEDFTKANWPLEAVANVSRRKVLGEILKVIQLK